MGLGSLAWRVRTRVVGGDRVVTRRDVRAIARSGAVSFRGRVRLDALLLRELVAGPARLARIRVGDALVEVGGADDFPVDWKAFAEVFAAQPYAGPYSGAAVLDVGAHKGYFGAYALAQGASLVVSFEPAPTNFKALSRSVAPLENRWIARNAALGRTAGEAVLQLDHASWAHSLVGVERPAGEHLVSVMTLEQALAELARRGQRTIVKIDAEGSECDIVQAAGSLGGVDLLMIETHPTLTGCSEEELSAVVASKGLRQTPDVGGVLRFVRH